MLSDRLKRFFLAYLALSLAVATPSHAQTPALSDTLVSAYVNSATLNGNVPGNVEIGRGRRCPP